MKDPRSEIRRILREVEADRQAGVVPVGSALDAARSEVRRLQGHFSDEIIAALSAARFKSLLMPRNAWHLARCSGCRKEVVELRRLVKTTARAGTEAPSSVGAFDLYSAVIRFWREIAGAATVFLLAAFLLFRLTGGSDSPSPVAVNPTNSASTLIASRGSTNPAPVPPTSLNNSPDFIAIPTNAPMLLASRGATNDGKQRVLFAIGINEYSPDTGLPSLHGAVNDANRVADLLGNDYSVVRRLTPSGEPRLAPTRENILRELSQLPKSADGGHLVIFWSGHGVGATGQAYLMPQGASRDPKLSGLTLEQLSEAVASSGLHFQSFILVLDVCKATANSPSKDFVKNLNARAKDWLILSAASEGGLAYERLRPSTDALAVPEAREPHGYFTYYLLESRYLSVPDGGILFSPADANRDGIISWGEAFAYAEGKLRQLGTVGGTAGGLSQPRQSPQRFGSEAANLLTTPFLHVQAVPTAVGDKIGAHQILTPQLDLSGRFALYTDIEDDTALPFLPEHWMWGNARKDREMAPHLVAQMMQLDLKSETQPEGGRGTCVRWQIIWKGNAKDQAWNATWAGVGWVAGSGDGPQWWATDNRGRYFNLETPRKFQRFHFSARSPRPGTVIKLKLGFMARDKDKKPLPLGDSLAYPIPVDGSPNESFALTTSWQHFTVTLEPFVEPHNHDANRSAVGVCQLCGDSSANPKRNNFERFCSLAFIAKKENQRDKDAPVEIYLDNLFFD